MDREQFFEAQERVELLLSSLGTDAASIAGKLSETQCRGERQNPTFCPLVRHLRRNIRKDIQIKIIGFARKAVLMQTSDGKEAKVRIPAACHKFITQFDAGEIPFLEYQASELELLAPA